MNKSVQRTVEVGNEKIKYELQYKEVKNINLRIKPDGKVFVSANICVSPQITDKFVASKSEIILRFLKNVHERNMTEPKKYFTEDEVKALISELCRKVYPYYKAKGVEFPQIKFRKMVSCWGNCRPKKKVLTFNTNLMYVPEKCVEYVVLHEFTHFLQPNHSAKFYAQLQMVCPEWKELRNEMKKIRLR